MTSAEPSAKVFRARLEQLVSRHLPASPDAEDIVQEVMLRLLRKPEAAPEGDPPVAWLQRVVSNAVIDHYRRRASEARAMARFADEPGRGGEPLEDTPAEQLRRGLVECLRPMLAQLGPEDREALELTDLGNLSQKQAAEKLGIGHSAMKSRVQRARRRLHAHLDACCQFELDGRRAPIDAQIRRDPCQLENT